MSRDKSGACLTAVFVDYDNIYLSLKRKNEEAAKRFAKEAPRWVRAIESGQLITPTNSPDEPIRRRLIMNRCYGNPVPRRNQSDNTTDMSSFPFVRHHFLRGGFEVVDCPPLTAQLKNSADIRMVMDMRDFLTHETHFDEFIILSSDADWIVTMDEDLQHPPDRIVDMLRRAAEASADLVYVQPTERVHGGAFRDLSSRVYKALIDRVTGNPTIRKANSFRLIRGDVARAAAATCGPDTYLDIALGWYTTRVETLPMLLVDERHVEHGASGYDLRRLLSHARRLAVSSHVRTLRFAALVGTVFFLLSLLGAILLLVMQLFTDTTRVVQGWTSLVVLISLLNGITLMLLGVATEYVSLLVLRAHGKPTFFVVDRSSDSRLVAHFSARARATPAVAAT